jgi:hypothetical protein
MERARKRQELRVRDSYSRLDMIQQGTMAVKSVFVSRSIHAKSWETYIWLYSFSRRESMREQPMFREKSRLEKP